MKALCTILLFLFSYFNGSAQYEKYRDDNFPLFKEQVKCFIDTIKKHSLWHGDHNVYVAYMYDAGDDTSAFCFTLLYLMLESESFLVAGKFMFTIDTDILLVNNDDKYIKKWKEKHYILPLDSLKEKRITGKLFTFDGIIFHYQSPDPPRILVWFDGKIIRSRVYKGYDRVPVRFSLSEVFSEHPMALPLPPLPEIK